MNAGHFQYLLSGGHSKNASSDQLELFAKVAAKRYLEEGTNLTDAIRKIAEENDLNANQIERVCEMANIATHKALWPKTAQKESVAFPLADSKTIIKVLKPSEGDDTPSPVSCPSGVDGDYAGPPKGLPTPGPSMMSMMGADPSKVHHGLGPEPARKQIIIVLQKKAAERSTMEGELLVKGMELETLEKKAFHTVKQSVLGGETFRDLYQAAVGMGLGKMAEEYLPEFEKRLIEDTHGDIRDRLEKLAISKAPDDLISNNMGNVSVINGAHPVMISLDTVQRKTGEIKNGLHNLLRIDDEVKTFKQRMRELS